MKNEVYNMDCIEYMRSLPDNVFDIAVCDPPYGKGNDDSLVVGGGEIRTAIQSVLQPIGTGSAEGRRCDAIIPPHKATGTDSEVVGENAITRRFQGGTWATRYKVQTGGGVFWKLPLGMLHHRRSFSTSSSVLVRIR